MSIEFRKYITRSTVQAERDKIFVFGDNQARVGYGGQAKEMRGEPNSFGIATKKSPSQFCVGDAHDLSALIQDLAYIAGHLSGRPSVVWPSDGIGTGLANLQDNWPEGLALIEAFKNCLLTLK